MLKVVNKKGLSPEPGWIDCYVARPSALGNPFKLEKESDRDKVVEQYRYWLWEQIKYKNNGKKTPAWLALKEIATLYKQGVNIRLVCFCKRPDKEIACHADVIKRAVEWLVKEKII